MTPNKFLAEVQALRQLIAQNHGREEWVYMASWSADAPAIRKFQAYCSKIFKSSERGYRLMTLGLLVGRDIDTSVSSMGKNGLTIGEIYAFLTWFVGPEIGLTIREDAQLVLSRLLINPAFWGKQINEYLEPLTLPIGVSHAATEPDMENGYTGESYEWEPQQSELPF